MRITFVQRKRLFALVSMADIAFLLLIFLVVTVTIGEQESVSLPEFLYARKSGFSQILILELSADGNVILDSHPVAALGTPRGKDELLETVVRLAADTAAGKDLVVRIAADRDTPYTYVDMLLSVLRQSDLTHIVLAAERKETGGTDGP